MALDKSSFKKIAQVVLPLIPKWQHKEAINGLIDIFVDDGVTLVNLRTLTWSNVSQFGEGVPFPEDKDWQAHCDDYSNGSRYGHSVVT